MTQDDYMQIQTTILTFAGWVSDMRLGDFIHAIEVANAAAPVLDPTAWRAGQAKMNAIRKLAEALLQFQTVAHQQKTILETPTRA